MAVYCPNRTRTKRVHKGGGKAGCQGRLQVVLSIGIMLPLKSLKRTHDVGSALTKAVLKRGVKVTPEMLRAAYDGRGSRDIVCPVCGWSLRNLTRTLKVKARR